MYFFLKFKKLVMACQKLVMLEISFHVPWHKDMVENFSIKLT